MSGKTTKRGESTPAVDPSGRGIWSLRVADGAVTKLLHAVYSQHDQRRVAIFHIDPLVSRIVFPRIAFMLRTEFKMMEGTDMAIDPVCGMEIEKSEAAGKSEYKGKTYYFCCEHCKTVFDKEPEKYISK